MKFSIPEEVQAIGKTLIGAGFEAYLVGGCVRDLLLDVTPKDWDIATNAKPEEVQKLFPDSVYENKFGTVLVKIPAINNQQLTTGIVEVTTYRLEGKYTDKRHPDEVKFAKTIEEDLSRRDFTVNAMALALQSAKRVAQSISDSRLAISDSFVDPFGGQKDLKEKLICAVGDPKARFNEDALRLLRAVRFAAQLGFVIEEKTALIIKQESGLIEFVSKERIHDEFSKLVMTYDAVRGVELLREFGLLKHIVPEILEGVGVGQNKHHIYTVYEHNLKSFEYAVKKNFPLDLRLASLFHDVGKPKSKRGEGSDSTFYGHQVVGEQMVLHIMDRLRFSKDLTEKVALLVREHMFVYDPDTVTLAGVRRLIARVGKENVDDLIKLREADRIGSGVPKAQPYRLRYLQAMIEKVQKDPVHPKMLKIKGEAVMEILKIEPGPRVGKILAVLLDEVLEDPAGNEVEILKKRVAELGEFSDKNLIHYQRRRKNLRKPHRRELMMK
jgi:tRNA nucleotidyltransferase (CCA-adding enzyme)